ncbi:MAG TPA: metallophosphoesterase family protein [Cytophagaceae bacterium]|jgi:serine/threonine protein phosphatase 1
MSSYAISDIHGCAKTFQALLKKISLKKEDQLFLLGDYINKGPSSKEVLDIIFGLKKSGYHVTCLRGNHDQMLIEVQLGNVSGSWEYSLEKRNTLESFEVKSPFHIPEVYISFLNDLKYYVETEKYFLVHAGFDFRSSLYLNDVGAMLNIKNFHIPPGKLFGKRIIRGHVPSPLSKTLSDIKGGAEIIGIDGGCVYYNNLEFGNLWALDLDSLHIITQTNLDRPYRINLKK